MVHKFSPRYLRHWPKMVVMTTTVWALRLIICAFIVLAGGLVNALERGPTGTIRVGIFPFEPFNFLDSTGKAQGLNPDLLREIIKDERWRVEFVQVSWAECLERLQKGEIDLMLSVAYSEERAKAMDYTYESVVELWGQVFLLPENNSSNINHLSGKRVGIMGKDISGSNFIKTAEKFGVRCEIVEYATHAEVFTAVKKKEVAAGVAPQHFGLRHAKEYNLVGSSIMFSPFSIYFASKKGSQHELLSHIDAHLAGWKKDSNSFYYDRLNYWLGIADRGERLPVWVKYSAFATLAALLLLAGFNLLLRRLIGRRTGELAASEARYRTLIEMAVDGILLGRNDGVIIGANKCMCEMLGLAEEKIVGRHINELPFKEGCLQVKPLRFDLLQQGETVSFERILLRSDGSEIVVEMRSRMMPDGSYQSVFQDITVRRRAELALQESEAKHRKYLESTPYGIFVADNQGRYLQVNPSACHITGYQESELLSMSIADLLPAENRPEGLQHFQKVLEDGSARGEYPFLHKNGETRWWSVSAVQVSTDRFLGFCNDITDQREGERKVLETNRLLKAVLAGTADAIFVKDLERRYVLANPIACLASGRSAEDIIGRTDVEIFPPEAAEKMRQTDLKVLATGQTILAEDKIDSETGIRYWQGNKSPYYNERQEIVGIIGVSRDITTAKTAETESEKLTRQLQQAQKMEAIGTLAGGIAHDFNNILGAILGYAEMVRDDCPSESHMARDLEEIIKAGQRARDLVKQILAFSRQDDSERMPIQLKAAIRDAVRMLRPSLPSTIEIRQEIAPDCGSVLADPTQLNQIIINLCTNAYHAMEEHGGILSIGLKRTRLSEEDLSRHPDRVAGEYVQLSISDTGQGIPPEIMERIFDPYFTTKETGKGTGLGLSIAHGIIKSHGGFITCYSEPGQGTVFHVYLPAITDQAEPRLSPVEAVSGGSEHILFIDDEEMLAEMARSMLERLGYTVTVKNSSLEALSAFQNEPGRFDLVITDQTMPGMTGVDLARRLLQIRPDLPIILCTGFSTQVSEEQARALGIREFAFKPLAKRDIAKLVRKVLDTPTGSGAAKNRQSTATSH